MLVEAAASDQRGDYHDSEDKSEKWNGAYGHFQRQADAERDGEEQQHRQRRPWHGAWSTE